MTIFRKIVEEFLIEGIEKIKATSMSYDQGAVNYARSLMIFSGRDLQLSENKRVRLDRLKNEIQQLPEATDPATKDALIDLITKCKHDLLEICTAKKRPTGSTELAVTDLNNFVIAAHVKICDYLRLTDVPADNKTINKLNYYAAKGCGRSVYEKECIKSSETLVLNDEKEKIIFETLGFAVQINKTTSVAKASKPLEVMEKRHFMQLITERAEFIQREVQKIDQLASNDYVIDYMNQAIESIMPPVPKVVAAKAFSIEDAHKGEESQSLSIT